VYLAPADKQGRMMKNGKATPSSGGNAMLGAFLGQLGLSDVAIRKLTEAGPHDMFYLNNKNIGELGIAAERLKTQAERAAPTTPAKIPPVRKG
jgi:hypothetical protein